MTKLIILLFLAVTLGCAADGSPSIQSIFGQGTGADQSAFGTLSSNPIEAKAAPVYTRLAMYRSTAAKDLRAGLIGVGQAQFVQDTANGIRMNLDAAVAAKDIDAINAQSAVLYGAVTDYEASK